MTKSGTIIAIAVNTLIIIVLILLMSKVPTMTPEELELTYAFTNLMILEIKLFVPISILIACIGTFKFFLPKSSDDPVIRMIKTCGVMGGLLIGLIVFLLVSR